MSSSDGSSLLAPLGRIYWLLLGPALLLLLAALVIRTGQGWLTAADIGFLAVLAGMALARWIEFRGGEPQTAYGQPATAGHLRRYLVGVLLVGLAAWVIANVIGNYLLANY